MCLIGGWNCSRKAKDDSDLNHTVPGQASIFCVTLIFSSPVTGWLRCGFSLSLRKYCPKIKKGADHLCSSTIALCYTLPSLWQLCSGVTQGASAHPSPSIARLGDNQCFFPKFFCLYCSVAEQCVWLHGQVTARTDGSSCNHNTHLKTQG